MSEWKDNPTSEPESESVPQSPSPDWHERVLMERQVEKAEYLDWDEAKKAL